MEKWLATISDRTLPTNQKIKEYEEDTFPNIGLMCALFIC
jgi:hypothetical protein